MQDPIAYIKSLAPLQNDHIKWTLCGADDIIRGRFNQDTWHLMLGEIETEKELSDFLIDYDSVTACFLLHDIRSGSAIGFVLILLEVIDKNTISIHGGGWSEAKNASWSYYRGICLIIQTLLNAGINVITSCLISNKRACRFLKSIGFSEYYIGNKCRCLHINKKSMTNSRIYKFLNRH